MSKVRSDNISNRADDGAPALVYGAEVPVGYGITGAGGINIAGVATAASFSGNATGLTGTPNIVVGSVTGTTGTFSGNISVGGTLTYEDVTNIDSVGVITARSGINVSKKVAGYDSLQAGYFNIVSGPTPDPIVYNVTYASKDSTHRYFGQGSGLGYKIDGVFSPWLTLTPGRKYRFLMSSSDMTAHPFRFYLEADKATAYTTNVTSTSTYTEILVTDSTPQVLHYQCSAHGYMGNGANTNSSAVVSSETAIFRGGLAEKYENAGTTLGSQPNNPLSDGNVILFTGNESGNKTINFTGVHATLSNGETVSFTAILTPNNSGVINVVQVDGQAITVKWSGGSAPSAGASGQDIYTFQILKTGTGVSNYTVFGAATNYA